MTFFYFLTAITYFFIGIVISFLHRMEFFKYQFPSWLRIIIVGIIVGISSYALSVVLPVSVHRTLNLKYVLFDMGWQIFEQTLGSAVFYLAARGLSFFVHPEFRD